MQSLQTETHFVLFAACNFCAKIGLLIKNVHVYYICRLKDNLQENTLLIWRGKNILGGKYDLMNLLCPHNPAPPRYHLLRNPIHVL